ncbi:MAG: ornithine cyclodeaminase family protein [Gemmatimonadetes bacterium]|nr:ornithine cyclodeaminase family protein [Gemmatimonadota bacterium]
MATLVLSPSDVRRLLPMDACIELMAEAFRTLSRGEVVNPLRWGMWLPGKRGILGMMPGAMESPRTFGLKVVAVMPGNHGTPYDSHQGVVLLFEHEHGLPLAILDASAVTAIRTAAASGVATRALAREDAGDLAILGSGVQARSHLEAMLDVRRIRRVRVYSRSPESRSAFAEAGSERYGIRVEAVDSARQAVEGADIVCTCTSSREPILLGDWLSPGTHVNAVGSSVAAARELDTEAVVRARLFVDRRESTLNEAGDFLFPKKEGAVDDEHIQGEIGEVLLGRIQGRRTPDEITLFKSLGLAVEDLAAAHYAYARARKEGLGVEVELGGFKIAAH